MLTLGNLRSSECGEKPGPQTAGVVAEELTQIRILTLNGAVSRKRICPMFSKYVINNSNFFV